MVAASAAGDQLRLMSMDRLSSSAQEALDRISVRRSWKAGEHILEGGVPAKALVRLDKGRLRVWAAKKNGAEVLRRGVHTGEITGLCSVFAGEPFPLWVTAHSDCTTTLYPSGDLMNLTAGNPQLAMEFARLLARKVHEMLDIEIETAHSPLDIRVYAALVRLGRTSGVDEPNGEVRLTVSQHDIASMVGCSREHVNATLRRLKNDGLVRLGYRCILLCPEGVSMCEIAP